MCGDIAGGEYDMTLVGLPSGCGLQYFTWRPDSLAVAFVIKCAPDAAEHEVNRALYLSPTARGFYEAQCLNLCFHGE